jgi:flagellar assembly protein FliH
MSEPRGGGSRIPAQVAIERWPLPAVEGPVATRPRDKRAPPGTPEDALRGYEAGMARAQAEVQSRLALLDARVQQLDALLQLLAQPLQSLDAEVEQQLWQLALAIGAQLARRELRGDPAQVLAILRECLEQLPLSAREVRVHMHPEDAAVVRERLAAPAEGRAWSLIEDPTLARGGCTVRSDTSHIDARFESRVNALVAGALGDQRSPARSEAAAPGAETESGE